jgi:hypothetical protein
MRAAVYVRYHSGDGFGHVAWAFDWSPHLVSVGAVENHSGAFDTPAARMGFWNAFTPDPTPRMGELLYDDVKYVDLDEVRPVKAYRVALWIKNQPFRAIHRNCLDDTYDVLRAYGVRHLDPPSRDLIPKEWFKRFPGTLAHVSDFRWDENRTVAPPFNEKQARGLEPVEGNPNILKPLRPSWRRPWHPKFHLLNLQKLFAR